MGFLSCSHHKPWSPISSGQHGDEATRGEVKLCTRQGRQAALKAFSCVICYAFLSISMYIYG